MPFCLNRAQQKRLEPEGLNGVFVWLPMANCRARLSRYHRQANIGTDRRIFKRAKTSPSGTTSKAKTFTHQSSHFGKNRVQTSHPARQKHRFWHRARVRGKTSRTPKLFHDFNGTWRREGDCGRTFSTLEFHGIVLNQQDRQFSLKALSVPILCNADFFIYFAF